MSAVKDIPAIDIEGLTKRYGTTRAVAGIDLKVERGEVMCLLGPNGAGKTTTTEILEGFRLRDGGRVSVLGVDPSRGDLTWRARIGIVPQTSGEQPELTVSEMVRHFARYYPAPRDPDEVVEAVGLSGKARTRVRKLSGGQRRRLDVALGIVGRPELLFLDEPTTGFDPQARHSFWQLIASLRDGGTTILLTTHYLDEAQRLADRVAVIAAGRVVALGAPDEIGERRRRSALVRWQEAGRLIEESTDEPTQFFRALTARLAPEGGEVPRIEIVRPSLEDVYLDLIREADIAKDDTDQPEMLRGAQR